MATTTTSPTGLSRHQIKKLVAKLDRKHVHQRQIEGKTIAYIEGWFAICEANAIFGFDGWDRETLQLERIYEQNRSQETQCAYSARVRIRVKAGSHAIIREGSGFGQASARTRADAHERALKAAETDATKRALATFGNRFGLSLYERDKTELRPEFIDPITTRGPEISFCLYGSRETIVAERLSAEAFCSGLRQLIGVTKTLSDLLALEEANNPTLAMLRATHKELVSSRGTHFADILGRLIAVRKTALKKALPDTTSANTISDPPMTEIGSSQTMSDEHQSKSIKYYTEPADTVATDSDLGAKKPIEPKSSSEPRITKGDGSSSSTVECLGEADGKASDLMPTPVVEPMTVETRIDKSLLLLGAERRIRSKEHLRFVSSSPCLICGELPCHAHHVTFAQPRGLAMKVSDEFTVPLCPMHHNLLHQTRNEPAFWRQQGIDALQEAAKYWARFRG